MMLYLMRSGSGPQSHPIFFPDSSSTQNWWSIRQLMKGHACQLGDPPTEMYGIVPALPLSSQDLLVTKCFTFRIQIIFKEIRVGGHMQDNVEKKRKTRAVRTGLGQSCFFSPLPPETYTVKHIGKSMMFSHGPIEHKVFHVAANVY